MLQRVQTLFLLGIIICMGIFVSLPIWDKVSQDETKKMTLDALYFQQLNYNEAESTWEVASSQMVIYIGIAGILAALVALYSIFRYNNRMLQVKLSGIIALLIMGAVVGTVVIIFKYEPAFDPEVKGNYKLGFFMPIIALLFNSLANRFIRKDEKLVRSVDRIR